MQTLTTATTAVTVYPNRARVTRQGSLSLKAGSHRLVIEDLPLRLVTDSVRASGGGSARARLRGVDVQRQQYVETPHEKIRDFNAQIRGYEDQITRLNFRYETLTTEQENLEKLGQQAEMAARGLFLRGQGVKTLTEVYAFIRERSQAIGDEQLSLTQQRRTTEQELDYVKRQRDQISSGKPPQRYQAVVEVDVLTDGELIVALTYVVDGASWRPLYDLRLSDAGLTVDYMAEVSQNTSEAWTGVNLALSTAFPTIALEMPELSPWYVQPYAPRPQAKMSARSRSAIPMAAPAVADDMMVMSAGAPEPAAEEYTEMEMDEAEVSESGAALTYTLQGGHDVPGGGDPRKITIGNFQLPLEMDYITIPKLQANVYRRAKITNKSDYTLLAGKAQLFENEEYLGAIVLDHTAPNEKFELPLGTDERIKVERKLTAHEVDKKFIGDRRQIRYAYEITLQNTRKQVCKLSLHDQLPLPRHEQIKVELKGSSPKPNEQNRLNELIWEMELAADSKQVVGYEYLVEHPRDMNVAGLP